MPKLLDFYIKEELLIQCEKHFAKYLEDEDSGYLTEEDYKILEDQINFIFKLMDEIIADHKREGKEEMEAYSQIIDQLCGYLVLGKMNEARLCNILNDMMDGKD